MNIKSDVAGNGSPDPVKIALDTNVFIYLLEDIEPSASKVEKLLNSFMKGENEGVISTINLAEILSGFYLTENQQGATKTKDLLKDLTISNFEIIPVTVEIADLGAKLRAKRGGKLPDALVAATAINMKAEFIYSQDKDMKRYEKDIKISEIT